MNERFIRALLRKETYRARKYFPCNIKGTVGSGTHVPFDQSHGTVLYFNAGNTAGVYTASGIVIMCRLLRKDRTVGMTGNQNAVICGCPFVQPFFTFVFYMIVFCCTGGV